VYFVQEAGVYDSWVTESCRCLCAFFVRTLLTSGGRKGRGTSPWVKVAVVWTLDSLAMTILRHETSLHGRVGRWTPLQRCRLQWKMSR
jgi:hypothetical protein